MRRLFRVAALLLAIPGAAAAQPAGPAAPTATAVRIEVAPVLDGRLDDPAWSQAPALSGFRQREPREGAEASEATVVRLAYDATHLYVAASLTDSQPADIRATELRRDNTLESDDTFSVLLDSYHDHRNAFVFRVNPRGTRFDALVRNESRFYYADWDEQWTAAAAIGDDGWTVEIAIPFKILRFTAEDAQTWGVNFERVIKRDNELDYWAGWGRDYTFHNVSQAGHLAGIAGIRQAERLRIRPYVVAGIARLDAAARPEGATLIGQVGIDDLKYAVTSTLTADLAVNPDFAQTEVDQQQVNLTRFSLFFPEKRQFFIEGADSLRMGVGLLHFGPPPLDLLYTRNIGLSPSGEPVPVRVGAKLTGKVSGYDVGLLNVQTGREDGAGGENFAVGRVRKEILGRSYIGGIVTNRQGDGGRNTVVGADARFTFFRNFNVMGLVARAVDRGDAPQWATQLGAEWRDDFVELGANYIDVDPAFTPGIGFVRIRERLVGVRGSVKPRPGRWGIRQFELTPSIVWYHDGDRELRSRDRQFTLGTAFQSGDRLDLSATSSVERVVRPFPIGPGVLLPAGFYEWTSGAVTFRAYNGRKVSGSVTASGGAFYDGDKRTITVAGDIRPGRLLSLNPSYSTNDVHLGAGDFVTHLFGLRANVSFSTNLLTSAFVQYNSAGQLAATQVRFNYIFRTIDNLYVVFNETRYTDGPFDGHTNRSFVMKITYSLHR